MAKTPRTQVGLGSILSTVSGPSTHQPPISAGDGAVSADLIDIVVGADVLSQTFPYNATKDKEYGEPARCPFVGRANDADDPIVRASSVSESNANEKTGEGAPEGENLQKGDLDRVRADSAGQALTTNRGVTVGNNQWGKPRDHSRETDPPLV